MASYGVLDTGFVDKPIEVIISELEEEQKSTIDPGLDVSATSPAGQMNGIFGAALRSLWELAQAVFSSWDPDKSSGVPLAALAALTGTDKEGAVKSTVSGQVNLDAGITLSAGAVASVDGNPLARFVTLVDVTNGGGSPANFAVSMEAETAGAVVANSGTLTVIETPESGWNTITNLADADIGAVVETDGELRDRREDELEASGVSVIDAIRADVLQVDDVDSVTVCENVTEATDGDGLPRNSFEVVVKGGVVQDIIDAIWGTKGGGIRAYGISSGTATDSLGASHTIGYTRPTDIDIYIDISVETNTDEELGPVFPSDGVAQIKAAVVTFTQATFGVGDEYVYRRLYKTIFAIDGVTDVPVLESDTAPAPAVEQNIAIGSRQISAVDSANIAVTEV